MENRRIYLDNAATTPLLSSVKEAMVEAMESYGNPSSFYTLGKEATRLKETARSAIANTIDANPASIFFTSGASESNAFILRGMADYAKKHGLGNHIVTTAVEHHSVMDNCKYLHDYHRVDITFTGVNEYGVVDPARIEQAIRPDTFLVCVMAANNEVGAINDIARISKIAHEHNAFFFTDATQLFGKVNIMEFAGDIDFLSASAHKIGGPKGTGLVYIRNPELTPLPSLISGTQENGFRGGTENVVGIVGFAKAVEEAYKDMYVKNNYIYNLSIHVNTRITEEIPGMKLNGRIFPRVPGILNYRIDGIRSEELLAFLDTDGIYISSGSACNSWSDKPSEVLIAMGLTVDEANSSIRISMSSANTYDEVDYAVDVIKDRVGLLRG